MRDEDHLYRTQCLRTGLVGPAFIAAAVCTFADARIVGLAENVIEGHARGGVWIETKDLKTVEMQL